MGIYSKLVQPIVSQSRFLQVKDHGKSCTGKYAIVNMALNDKIMVTKTATMHHVSKLSLGLKVTKKFGNAVLRNKIRRRIKACVVGLLHKFLADDENLKVILQSHIVIVARARAKECSYFELNSEIEKILISLVRNAPN